MRNAFFIFYATLNSWALAKISNLTEALTQMTVHFSHAVFQIIDKNRLSHLRSIIEQQDLIDELKVFSLIDEVKNDAIDSGEWNEDHETQLNWYGNILYNQHDWEVEEVHRYLTDVIERASITMKD
jgi:hypothetical protein